MFKNRAGQPCVLTDHDVVHASRLGWDAMKNVELLTAAELDGVDLMITGDKNIEHQQDLSGRKISVIVLSATHGGTVQRGIRTISSAIAAADADSYTYVGIGRPALRQRLFPPVVP
jgi:hypothetical protein